MTAWASDLYTGLFSRFGPLRSRAHDPQLFLYSGTAPLWNRPGEDVLASGAGWTAEEARYACVGEAVERLQASPSPDDQQIEASFRAWTLDEPAVSPGDWVLYHAEQYAHPGFPFRPFTDATICSWLCCREATTGLPWWVPAEMVWLHPRPGGTHHLTSGVSTGLACGQPGQPLVLRGLQEVIERDAVVGAWWGRYALEEYSFEEVVAGLELPDAKGRLARPNLAYRCFRIDSPFSSGATLVTLEGEDREGYCFSVGSACRETTAQSWRKAIVEAIHGRHYVRHLKSEAASGRLIVSHAPTGFAEHAVYYSLHPERLRETVLTRARGCAGRPQGESTEGLDALRERLGPRRPVLVRNMTPIALACEGLSWYVVRVVVPGLQPLHGNHVLAHLGGKLWAPRGLTEWIGQAPHPFP